MRAIAEKNFMGTYLPDDVVRRYPLFSRISAYCRRRRIERFIRIMNVSEGIRILDVGGLPYYWADFPIRVDVTCLNLSRTNAHPSENLHLVGYDGGEFPFADQSFGIVHSNSVIEHVGDYQAQRKFAGEIVRVGKKYWVQTPNFFFPFEPHAQFPCFQYLPPNLKLFIGQRWPKAGYPYEELLSIHLLTKSQLRDLFPSARIWDEKLLFLPKSYCVYSDQ